MRDRDAWDWRRCVRLYFLPTDNRLPDYTILSIKVDTVSPAALDSVIIGNAEISTYLSADIEVTL